MDALESLDLDVDPFRFGRSWRAEDEEAARRFERIANLFIEIVGCCEIVLIAEDRRQAFRHYAIGGHPAAQDGGDAKALEFLVQPVRVFAVVMAVTEEGEIVGGRRCAAAAGGRSRCVTAFERPRPLVHGGPRESVN